MYQAEEHPITQLDGATGSSAASGASHCSQRLDDWSTKFDCQAQSTNQGSDGLNASPPGCAEMSLDANAAAEL